MWLYNNKNVIIYFIIGYKARTFIGGMKMKHNIMSPRAGVIISGFAVILSVINIIRSFACGTANSTAAATFCIMIIIFCANTENYKRNKENNCTKQI